MSDKPVTGALDFDALPIAQACGLLQRLARTLALDVLTQRLLVPLSALLRPGEERLLAPAARRDLQRHRRAAGIKRAWLPWPKRARATDLGRIGQAWRNGETSRPASYVLALEQIELGYGGVTAQRLSIQFWQLAGIRAWRDLAFQYELAAAIRSALHTRVLFTTAEMQALYPQAGGIDLLAPQTFWLLIAAAETSPIGVIWRRSQRRLRSAAARLQAIADMQINTEHWAGFWDQWLILELARQDKTWFNNLTPQLQAAIGALPIFQALPAAAPQFPPQADAPALRLAASNAPPPGWFNRLYLQDAHGHQADQAEQRETT